MEDQTECRLARVVQRPGSGWASCAVGIETSTWRRRDRGEGRVHGSKRAAQEGRYVMHSASTNVVRGEEKEEEEEEEEGDEEKANLLY